MPSNPLSNIIPPQRNPFAPKPQKPDTVVPDNKSPTGYSDRSGNPVSPAPEVVKKNSGGGGGSSRNNNQPSYTDTLGQPVSPAPNQPVNPATDIQRNIQQPTKFIDVLKGNNNDKNLQALNINRQSIQQQDQQSKQGFIQRIKDRFTSTREKAKEERIRAIQGETYRLTEGATSRPFVQSGRGTIVTEKTTDFTNEQLINMAGNRGIYAESALNVIAQRENQKYGNAYNQVVSVTAKEEQLKAQDDANKATNQAKIDVDNYRQKIQEKYDNGYLSDKQANDLLNSYVDARNKVLSNKIDSINERTNNNIQAKADAFVQGQGKQIDKDSQKYLEKVSDKIALEKTLYDLPQLVVGSAIIGGASIPFSGTAGALATAGRLGGQALIGTSVGSTAGSLTISAIEGRLTASKVATALIPFVAMGAGGIAGARAGLGFKGPTTPEVQNALLRSRLETKIGKSITNEVELSKIGLSETQAPQVLAYAKAGAKISEIEIQVKPVGGDKITIGKALDGVKIRGVQIERTLPDGTVEKSVVANVEATKGALAQQVGVIQTGRGTFNQQTQQLTMENLGFVVGNKGVVGATKTLDISTGKTDKIMSAIVKADGTVEYGQVREISGKGYTFQGGQKIAKPKEVLTEKDISKVANSDYERLIRQSKFNEKQLKTEDYLYGDDINLDIKLANRQTKYNTLEGTGVSEYVPEQIPFIKTKVTKEGYQDFSYLKPKEVSKAIKDIESGSSSIKLDMGKPVELKEIVTPKSDLSSELDIAFQKIGEQLNGGKVKIRGQKSKLQNQIEKQTERIKSKIDIKPITIEDLDLGQKIKTRTTQDTGQSFANAINEIQKQDIVQRQIQPENLEVKPIQINALINPPRINIPDITFPGFSLPGIPGGGGGQKKQAKKIKKIMKDLDSGYTASLSAAFLQETPVKVTKKQYEALGKQTYSGLETRPVLEIISDKETKKLMKKIKSLKL